MPSLGSRGCPPCSPAPPTPRPPLRPSRRRLRSRRSLSSSPPAPSRNKAPPGGVGNLHRRPRFERQHPERVEGHFRPSYRARIRRSVFLVAAARIGGCPFPRAAFSGLPNGYVAGYARRRRTKGRELATHGSDALKSGALGGRAWRLLKQSVPDWPSAQTQSKDSAPRSCRLFRPAGTEAI